MAKCRFSPFPAGGIVCIYCGRKVNETDCSRTYATCRSANNPGYQKPKICIWNRGMKGTYWPYRPNCKCKIPVYRCELFGDVTLIREVPMMMCCSTCRDRKENNVETQTVHAGEG